MNWEETRALLVSYGCGFEMVHSYSRPGFNLNNAHLEDRNLQGALLEYSDLRSATLSGANLSNANLRNTTLFGAICLGTNFTGACLNGADLRFAALSRSKFCGADLSHACFVEAGMTMANLEGAHIDSTTIGLHPAPEGDLIGWGKKDHLIVKMLIPAGVSRSCATARKHRAACVKTLEIADGTRSSVCHHAYGRNTIYTVGEFTYPSGWDSDRWYECSKGIHFFLTREEAEQY